MFGKERRDAMRRAFELYASTGIDTEHPAISRWLVRDDGRWVVYAPAVGQVVWDDRQAEAFLIGVKAARFNGGV